MLKGARTDKKEKDIKLVGLAEDSLEAEDAAKDLGVAVRDLLRQRVRQERQLAAVDERAAQCRGRANDQATELQKAQDVMASMHYRRRGVVVPTPYFGPS